MKSALFVDFDNVYSGLRRMDPDSADQFARSPSTWLSWLVDSLPLPAPLGDGTKRRLLVRRCYLNPQAHQRFRPSFNVAGFEIVDCPALTGEGKTSTDIHMVLDIVDLLQHEVRYDEFIVFSADADFTPVLRKLRRWDRRTTVLAIGFPSAAYRASADLLIDQDEFVRHALFASTAEPVPVASYAPRVSGPALGDVAVALIRQMVSESSAPVPLARIASRLLSEVDGLDASTWSGHGSFREMIESMNLMPLVISWEAGGTISDPSRQAESNGVDRAVRARNWPDPALYDSAKRIHELTDVPLLTPEEYRNLLTMIVEDVREAPFHLVETSKRVRDRSRASGFPVSRADVNHVLRGLLMRGHKFDEGQNDYAALRSRLVDNIRSLCLREQIVLDSGTDGAIQRWIAT